MEVEGLERNFEALNGAANDEEARLRELERKPHKIALVYLIWLRCFLFAVSRSSSSHKCVPWWMVVGLILSATAVHLLVFVEAVTMMFRTLNALNIILREQTAIWHRILDARKEEHGGQEHIYRFQIRELNYGAFRIVERKVHIAAIACALLGVTAFEVCACKYSLPLC